MITLQENVSLRHLNTFGIDARARYFTEITSAADLVELLQLPTYRESHHLILGGGSNILFTKDYEGLVIKSSIHGVQRKSETEDLVLLEAAAGENWHSLVQYCVERDLGGIENLSLIPGTAGAAPMQNIGAYGVEIKDVIESVTGIELNTGVTKTFSNSDCHFNYRESIFKQASREKYFISSITLRLTKKKHQLNTTYGALRDVLNERGVTHPSIKDVCDAVIFIRKSKLPDPGVIGNAGSFFKNPTVDQNTWESLKKSHPTIPSYPVDNHNVKIAAGWLIEQCGWKGKRIGDVGVHPKQALVLVNYGNGNGAEIFELAMKIERSVRENFGIELITEVNII